MLTERRRQGHLEESQGRGTVGRGGGGCTGQNPTKGSTHRHPEVSQPQGPDQQPHAAEGPKEPVSPQEASDTTQSAAYTLAHDDRLVLVLPQHSPRRKA
jgi:hypothetical protein